MGRLSSYARIEVESFQTETDLACLFIIEGEKVWIPKSLLRDDDFDEDDEWFDIFVQEWFADQEGLI